MNKKVTKFSPEVRERAARLVREQRSERPSMWAVVESIAPMIGCTPQALHEWVKRDQVEQGERDGVTSDERERLKALKREVKELQPTRYLMHRSVREASHTKKSQHVIDTVTGKQCDTFGVEPLAWLSQVPTGLTQGGQATRRSITPSGCVCP
nr:hypothetical protein [Burkholderia ambifaria]